MMEQMGGAGGMPDFGAEDGSDDGEDAEADAAAEGEPVADKGKGKAEVSVLVPVQWAKTDKQDTKLEDVE
jgi:hypothetical protein